MTATDPKALRELLARATGGTWRWSTNGNIVTNTPNDGCDPEIAAVYTEHDGDDDYEPANSALICAVVNGLPALLDELDAARARIAEFDTWLPIETAPKDGRLVILVWNSAPPYVGRFIEEDWIDECGGLRGPTHWRPMPNPPADAAMARDGGA